MGAVDKIEMGNIWIKKLYPQLKRAWKIHYIKIRMVERGDTVCPFNCNCCEEDY